MGKVTRRGTLAEQWARQIKTQIGKSVESIIGIGQLLTKAKAELPHGEWLRMFDEGLLPFSVRSAQMLMAVAANPVLADTNHGSYLPPSWRTLYDLTRLPESVLRNAFRDGLITPATERHEVRNLIPRTPIERREPDPVFLTPEAPRNGMKFARQAVADLEQIEDEDQERADAFAYVLAWLSEANSVIDVSVVPRLGR